MKKLLLAVVLLIVGFVLPARTFAADDAGQLNGKWLTKKVNGAGQNYSQTIEIKKDKFIFQILGADDEVVLYATGDVKAEKLGPFNSARFYNIRGGSSASNLDEVDDEYNSIYQIEGDTLTVASNFDKQRDAKASADVYQRVKASAAAGGKLVIDAIEMTDTPQVSTWFICFEAETGGVKAKHYQENKAYDKNKVTIPLSLELPKVQLGQKCLFKMQLDDVDEDACGDDPDNRSTGEFTITEQGAQIYKPESNWRYTIRWHLKQ